MLVVESARFLLPILDEYLVEKIVKLTNIAIPNNKNALEVLIEKFISSDAANRGVREMSEGSPTPRRHAADARLYNTLINVYADGKQLTWAELMSLPKERLHALARDQLTGKASLGFLKEMIIARLHYQLVLLLEKAESDLIERERQEDEVASKEAVFRTIRDHINVAQEKDITAAYGWDATELYFSRLRSNLLNNEAFDFKASLASSPDFINIEWSEKAFHDQIAHSLLYNHLNASEDLFKEREVAREFLDKARQTLVQKEAELLSAQVEHWKLDSPFRQQQEIQNEQTNALVQFSEVVDIQKEEVNKADEAYQAQNELLKNEISKIKEKLNKAYYIETAKQLLVDMEHKIENKKASLQVVVEIEQNLITATEAALTEARALLTSVLADADVSYEVIERGLNLRLGAGAGDSEELIAALLLPFDESVEFIRGQNHFNMRPSRFYAAMRQTKEAHPVDMLYIQALNYILGSAKNQAEVVVPGSQHNVFSSAWNAILHPVEAVQRFIKRWTFDAELAKQKRQTVSGIVTKVSEQASSKKRTTKPKHWEAALTQLDAGYSELSKLSYKMTPYQQQSLVFLSDVHKSFMTMAPEHVQATHKCRR